MSNPELQVDAFIDALRSNLPSARDEQRVRARLTAAGLLLTSLAAPSTAAAAALSGGAKAGVAAKLSALSWMSKAGLAAALATVTAVPAALQLAGDDPRSAAPREGAPRLAPGRPPAPKAAAAPSLPPPAATPPELTGAQPRVARTAPAPVHERPPIALQDVAEDKQRSSQPTERPAAVSAFPSLDAPGQPATAAATGSLRAETELMERALLALRQGDRAGAARFLQQHGHRFPDGILARDRQRALARLNEAQPTQRELEGLK